MISIIIIVKNDPRIEKLLLALRSIHICLKYEIIVIDASGDKLYSIKEKYPEVLWIQYTHNKKKKTYAEQRNIGVTTAKGAYIVFIDADCVPEKNWLTELIKPMIEENEKIVSGACRPLKKNYLHKEEQYGKYREECETMNMGINKEVFSLVGLFDENLEGCEDSDFCIRARNNGLNIRHQATAIVYHDWGGLRKNIIRSFSGGQDRVRLYRKHTRQLLSLSINNIYTLYYLVYLLCLPIAFYIPSYLLVIFIPSIIKKRNPVKEIFNLCFSIGFLKQLLYI